jgi:hypothetical protein
VPVVLNRLDLDIAYQAGIPRLESTVAYKPAVKATAQTWEMKMMKLPHPWDLYALQQDQLKACTRADDTAWGLEAGLTFLLAQDDVFSVANTEALTRKISNAVRRSRYARALLAKYMVKPAMGVLDDQPRLEARDALNTLEQKMPRESLALLFEIAKGATSHEIAADQGIDVGALRTRIARARNVARRLAA